MLNFAGPGELQRPGTGVSVRSGLEVPTAAGGGGARPRSGFRGVRWSAKAKKWCAAIAVAGGGGSSSSSSSSSGSSSSSSNINSSKNTNNESSNSSRNSREQ